MSTGNFVRTNFDTPQQAVRLTSAAVILYVISQQPLKAACANKMSKNELLACVCRRFTTAAPFHDFHFLYFLVCF